MVAIVFSIQMLMSVTQKMVDIGVSNSAQMQMGVLFAIAMMVILLIRTNTVVMVMRIYTKHSNSIQ